MISFSRTVHAAHWTVAKSFILFLGVQQYSDKFNTVSHDSETPRLIANGPVSAQNGPIEDACKFTIFGRSGWRRMSIHDICVFLSTKIWINVNTPLHMCRICLYQTLYIHCWLCSTCVDQFLHGNPFFINHAFLMNFEFLSTTVNQGTITRIKKQFIVNKINKFNISGFRNTGSFPTNL